VEGVALVGMTVVVLAIHLEEMAVVVAETVLVVRV
jgi:hypothetical protein